MRPQTLPLAAHARLRCYFLDKPGKSSEYPPRRPGRLNPRWCAGACSNLGPNLITTSRSAGAWWPCNGIGNFSESGNDGFVNIITSADDNDVLDGPGGNDRRVGAL